MAKLLMTASIDRTSSSPEISNAAIKNSLDTNSRNGPVKITAPKGKMAKLLMTASKYRTSSSPEISNAAIKNSLDTNARKGAVEITALSKNRNQPASSTQNLASQPKKITGLPNIGNTCYLNSIMQIVRKSQPFFSQLVSHAGQLTTENHTTPFLSSMLNIFENANHVRQALQNFKATLDQLTNNFQDATIHHDSSEFLIILLRLLSTELIDNAGLTSPYFSIIADAFKHEQVLTTTCLNCETVKQNIPRLY